MSRYIKTFNTEQEYNAYSGGTDFITPNISYIKGNDKTKYDENEIRSYKEPSWIEPISLESFTGTTFGDLRQYITNVEIPNSVISIGNNAFQSCNNLTSITIPNTVTSIGNYAFLNCRSLTSINIPNAVISIGDRAFDGCRGLTSITFPNNIESIGSSILMYNELINTIDLPSSLTSFGGYIFGSFAAVIGPQYLVISRNPTPPNLLSQLGNVRELTGIYVPDESVELYKSASNWSVHTDKIKPLSELPNE